MAKQTIKVSDLLQVSSLVEVSPDKQLEVRPLSLREMLSLLVDQSDNFLGLYAKGIEGKLDAPSLIPFLLACPELVAKIIALATDNPDNYKLIETRMAATVQLIALQEIWKLSVPDQKKAEELLSVVTALLRKLSKKGEELQKLKVASPKNLSIVSTPQ